MSIVQIAERRLTIAGGDLEITINYYYYYYQ